MSRYTTIKDVPLIRAGTWNASVGGTTPVTAGDIEAMAAAASDPDLDRPVVKIGHVDGRFPAVSEDGEPAYGQIENIRASEDGLVLLGDLVNVPVDLAEKMPSAYPHRSAEFRSNVALKDAAGKVLKQFKRVITAIALLGATPPAVKGLGSVHAALSDGHALESEGAFVVHLKLGAPLTAEQTRQALAGAIGHAGDVVDFTDRLCWYKVPVPAPTGVAYRYFQQGYSETDGQVELVGEPVEVEPAATTGYIPVPQSDTAPAAPAQPDTPTVPLLADTPNETPSDTETERTQNMATLADLFTAVDVPIPEGEDYTLITIPDAAVEAVANAFAAVREETKESDAETPAGGSSPSEPTSSVTLSEAQFSELVEQNRSMSERLTEMETAAAAERRDEIIQTALAEGRLHPNERDAWRTALDENEQVTTTLLSDRQQVFPISEVGSANAPASVSLTEAREKELDNLEAAIFGKEG